MFYKAVLTFFILFSVSGIFSQNTVSIYGSVVDDATGETLIGVNIFVEGTDKGATTDLDGNFILEGLMPGAYNITASYLGYQTYTISNVLVQTKGNDDLNFRLLPSSVEIQVVEVTANPFRTSLESPVSLQRLSPEEIRTYPGGNNDIAKVVQSLPGVSGSIGGFRNDVIIRGGAPNENVYYLDGVEIPNINHFSTQGSAGGPVGLLNVDFIENVELSSSGFGARYDNPLSGVLQFDQKIGNPRERQTNLRVSASETSLTTEGPLFKKGNKDAKTSYIVSARRSYLQFLFELIGLPIRPDYWDYQYKINHEIDERNTIYLTGIGSIDDFSVKAPEEFDPEQQAVLDQVPIIQQRTNTIGLGWKRLLPDGKGVMRTVVSHNYLKNDFSAYEDNENLTGLYIKNVSTEGELKARYEYTRFLGNWTVAGGGNLVNADYSNDSELINFGLNYVTDINFFRYGLFAQATGLFKNGRMSVSLGLRADDNTFSTEKATFIKTLSPRASISVVLDQNEKWRFNSSVGKYHKILPYTILGFQDASGSFANQSESYIASYHAVSGIEYRLGNYGKLSVEGFYKYYDNYAVSVRDGVSLGNKGADFSVLGNEEIEGNGKGRSYGAEFLFQQKLYKNFYGILAYTLFQSEFTGADGVFRPSVWNSNHLLSFTGGYKVRRSWEFSARYRFAGRTPYAPVDLDQTINTYPELVLDYNNLGKDKLDPFQQLDIRIDKKWSLKRVAINLYLEFQNVLANNIPSPPSFGLDRDDSGAIVEPQSLVQIQENPSSILPVIGFAIDF
jgi:hypothetical protein